MEPIVIFTADEIEDIKKIRLNSNEKFITNGEPEQILWLIDFIQNDVVNCPVNNTYDCIRGLYQTDVQKFLNDKNNFYENKVYIYLSRDMYTSYNNINEQIILNTNNLKDNNIEKSKFGFVLRG